jgi:hypothetical protein
MSEKPAAPQIQPSLVDVMGANIEVLCVIDPKRFPLGVDVLLMEPGKLEPLGKGTLAPGTALGVLPPVMVQELMRQFVIAQQQAQQEARKAGKVVPGAE